MKKLLAQSNLLHIKNMICDRCIRVIREEFEELNIKILNVSLGEVETAMALPNVTINKLKIVLEKNGFELIEDKRIKTIEDIKNFIINTNVVR